MKGGEFDEWVDRVFAEPPHSDHHASARVTQLHAYVDLRGTRLSACVSADLLTKSQPLQRSRVVGFRKVVPRIVNLLQPYRVARTASS